MTRKSLRSQLIAGVCCMIIAGCETAGRQPFADSPLLQDKKPTIGKLAPSGSDKLAPSEPTPPPAPSKIMLANATVAADPSPALSSSSRVVAATPAARSQTGSVQAKPTSQRKKLTEATADPAIRRQVPETYGHAADYSWLQGVLDRDVQGRFGARYCDPGTDDRWGGKVFFSEDARLGAFHPGDIILVKGELLPAQQTPDAWQRFPSYRIDQVWLSERGSAR